MLGTNETIIIIAAVIFLFGGKKVVDWAQSLKQAKKVITDTLNEETPTDTTPKQEQYEQDLDD